MNQVNPSTTISSHHTISVLDLLHALPSKQDPVASTFLYLNDTLPDGIIQHLFMSFGLAPSLSTSPLKFSVAWCCDHHSGNKLAISLFVPGLNFSL